MWIAGLPRPMRAIVVAGLRRSGQQWMARVVHAARPRSADAYWQLVERKNQLVAQRHCANMRQQGIEAIICPPHALPATPHVKAFDLLGGGQLFAADQFARLAIGHGLHDARRGGRRRQPADSRDPVLRNAQRTDHGSVGLPVGVQVSSLPWREDIVLAIMRALENSSSVKPKLSRELRRSGGIK